MGYYSLIYIRCVVGINDPRQARDILRFLYCVHKGALHLIKHDDADAEQDDHERETVSEHPPVVATDAEHAVFEELDNARERIQLHD